MAGVDGVDIRIGRAGSGEGQALAGHGTWSRRGAKALIAAEPSQYSSADFLRAGPGAAVLLAVARHGGMAMNAASSAIARMARAGAAQYDLARLDQEQRDHTARGNTRVDRVLNVSPVLTDPIPR